MNAVKILILIMLALSVVRLMGLEIRKAINFQTLLFWSAILIGSITLFINPSISDNIAWLIGIGRGVDSMFFLSILLLFYINFQLYLRIQKLDRDLTNLTIQASKKLHTYDQRNQ